MDARNAYEPKKKTSRKGTALTKQRRRLFLEALRKSGKVNFACEAAGWHDPSPAYRHRKADPEFAREWDEALEIAADTILEPEAMRRAVEGTMEPNYYKGAVVGYTVKYSDQLVMFLLRGAKPDKYRDNVKVENEIRGKVGIALLPMTAPSMEEWERAAIELHLGQKLLPPAVEPMPVTIDVKPNTVIVRK